MKYNSTLTKRYYFPIVEGSNYGYFKGLDGKTHNAFTSYIPGLRSLVKVVNYSQVWHWFGQRPIMFRKGYHYSWYNEGNEVIKSLNKANKYLNRQYCRLDKNLREGNVEKYTKIFDLISKRSLLFRLVLIVRKLPFQEATVLRVLNLVKNVGKLMKRDATNLRINRVFLPEYDSKGILKKYRPLGVPAVEWRIIGAMKEMYLVNLWAGDWRRNQYACMPKRGAGDAWIAILEKLSYSDKISIIGYDLAKFFDSIYRTTLNRSLANLPVPTQEWFKKACESESKVKPMDRKKELKRLMDLLDERPINRWLELEDMGTSFFNYAYNAPNPAKLGTTGFPQGWNISPVLSCKVLQDTGALNNDDIIQYMDDGLIMSSINRDNGDDVMTFEDLKTKLTEFIASLATPNTGITISARKTEFIKRGEKWLRPLKFLGCSYDGDTFKAHTRTGGIYEVKDARERINEILQWLKVNGHQIGPYKNKVTQLMAEGWNKSDVKTTWWTLSKGGRPQFELTTMFSTWWEESRARITRLPYNSVEAMSYMRYKTAFGPMWESSNTQGMLCSFYVLNLVKDSSEARKRVVLNRQRASKVNEIILSMKNNRLMSDW